MQFSKIELLFTNKIVEKLWDLRSRGKWRENDKAESVGNKRAGAELENTNVL